MPATPQPTLDDPPLLDVRDLRVALDLPAGEALAVDGVSMKVRSRETVCLVGESGCGKSLTALAIPGLLPRPVVRRSGGEVSWKGSALPAAGTDALRQLRGRAIGFVFQEPRGALNPVHRVGRQLVEAVRAHGGVSAREGRRRALELLVEVGIPAPQERLHAYPHQLSGGMCQRVAIAAALAAGPELLIADEPTTALDVTVQAQILRLLARLQRERGMALLVVTHDLALVAQTGDRVAVMYAGRIVEEAPAAALFVSPRHPYTRGLLDSLPDRQQRGTTERLHAIPGSVPAPGQLPSGCRFRDRCAAAQADCAARDPALQPAVASVPGHRVACLHPAGPAS